MRKARHGAAVLVARRSGGAEQYLGLPIGSADKQHETAAATGRLRLMA